MKKSKSIFKALLWPILLGVGQFFISFCLFLYFASQNPSLKGQALTHSFASYLGNYLWIPILWNLLVFLPLFWHHYQKYKIPNQELTKSTIFSIVTLSFPLCIGLNLLLALLKENTSSSFSLLFLISSSIMGPLLEEITFRGIAYQEIQKAFSKKTSIIFITCVFAFFHQGLLQILYAFCMGFLFFFLQEKHHSIFASIISHTSVNALAYFLSFVFPIVPNLYKGLIGVSFLFLFAFILHKQLKNT